MADDFGRVNPVSQQYLDRDVHEKAFSGRHARKHQNHDDPGPDSDGDSFEPEEAGEIPAKSHIDLRI